MLNAMKKGQPDSKIMILRPSAPFSENLRRSDANLKEPEITWPLPWQQRR